MAVLRSVQNTCIFLQPVANSTEKEHFIAIIFNIENFAFQYCFKTVKGKGTNPN